MKGCKMPGCQRFASKHWALVDVCYQCFDNLQSENQKYYAKRLKASDRVLYKQIKEIKGVVAK